MNKKYRITRLFLSGILEGLTYTGITSVYMPLGWICEKPIGGDPYKIIAVEEIV